MTPYRPGAPLMSVPAGDPLVPEKVAMLSPREREIALGVRVGSSNSEIAKRLGLSVKTVEYHLSRIYARLGFRSRAQLAALVEREMNEA